MNHDLTAVIDNAPVSNELYRTFLKTFQGLQDPLALAESPLLERPLVQRALQQDENAIPYQVLKKVFGEVLDLLTTENAEYADLLRGRFWEGQQVEEMLTAERPLAMSRRTFANYQKNAIQTFAFLFLQAESGRQQQTAAATPAPAAATPPTATPPLISQPLPAEEAETVSQPTVAQRPRRLRMGAGLLLVALGLIGFILFGYMDGMGSKQILFADDFENGAGQWWLQERNLWTVREETAGNHVFCVRTTGNYTYALAGSTTWRDYIIELDLKIVTSANKGSGNLIWRVADDLLPFYLVDFFANAVGGAVLAKETPAYETLDETVRGFPEKQWVPVRIEVNGGQMTVFRNNETTPMLQTTDVAPIPQGAIGLGAGFPVGESGGVWEICFDNVRVTAW